MRAAPEAAPAPPAGAGGGCLHMRDGGGGGASAATGPRLGEKGWRRVDADELGKCSFQSAERVRYAPHGGGVESERGGEVDI